MTAINRRPCRLFLFDLDGTLIDSREDIAYSVNLVLNELGLDPLPISRVVEFVGKGVKKLLERTLKEIYDREPQEDLLQRGITIFREEYSRHMLDKTCLYGNVEEALERLSWADMVVVSNKPERYSRPILEGLQVAYRFRAILGEETTHAYKPDPAPLEAAMEFCGKTPSETVMVGDSSIDIEAGKAAGVFTCAVTGGYHTREKLHAAEPDLIVDSLLELENYFYDGAKSGNP